jgi:hypothetical protein
VREAEVEESQSKTGPRGKKCKTLSGKKTEAKRARGMIQVVKHLPIKH